MKGNFKVRFTILPNAKRLKRPLEKQDEARIKEIHHRIKNNLQVISSLLDLQAEKFDEKNRSESRDSEAFKESQNRVISMALIHEELYRSRDMSRLDFASYLQRLAKDLLRFIYRKNRIII